MSNESSLTEQAQIDRRLHETISQLDPSEVPSAMQELHIQALLRMAVRGEKNPYAAPRARTVEAEGTIDPKAMARAYGLLSLVPRDDGAVELVAAALCCEEGPAGCDAIRSHPRCEPGYVCYCGFEGDDE